MANLCECGARKNHAVHVIALGLPGAHKYRDPSKAGLSGIGKGREEYLESEKHKEAYAGVEGGTCLAGAAGAPGACGGGITAHHVFARSAAGGQEAAEDGWPVIPVCAFHNSAFESSPAARRWAERTTFVWAQDGNEYAFRINAAMARRIKEEREQRPAVRI